MPQKNTIVGVAWYRMLRHPMVSFFSFFLTIFFSILLCYVVGQIYPDFKLYYQKLLPEWFSEHGAEYNFYSGENKGVYGSIGRVITSDVCKRNKDGTVCGIGILKDKDVLKNHPTAGGYENFTKVTAEGNSFGLVQQAVINMQDEQVSKGMQEVAPLFFERLHIFYRKGLFGNNNENLQLASNMDYRILNCFRDNVKNIEVGPVGSCTRIIATDVLDLIERQMKSSGKKDSFSLQYVQRDYLLTDAFNCLHNYTAMKSKPHKADSLIDIMFYVGADPTDDVQQALHSGYALMSINPSFLSLLNKEFKLGLQVTDFQKKYDCTEHITTVGTLTYLIASRGIRSDDTKRVLQKIHDSTRAIHKAIISLPKPICNDSCYMGINENCAYVLPLAEVGYYKLYADEDREFNQERLAKMAPFLIAVIAFFFPIFKSVGGLTSLWRSWSFNKQIDHMINPKKYDHVKDAKQIKEGLEGLIKSITNLYGDGIISESHYNALIKRIAINMPEAPVVKPITRDDKDDKKNNMRLVLEPEPEVLH